MSKIAAAFKKQRKCFIPFITAGDPDLDVTEQLIVAMANAGADIVELGIPFSDPVAEGEVIQAANIRALSAGTTTDKIFVMLKNVRTKTYVPLVFLTYINPIFTYGTEKFLANCQSVGLDGIRHGKISGKLPKRWAGRNYCAGRTLRRKSAAGRALP